MDTTAVIVTTFGGAFSPTLGVLVGGVVTRRVQERHWLRDKNLRAYEELFAQYSRFMMQLRQAHPNRAGFDADWAARSVALTSASLVAPLRVARAIDGFAHAVNLFLNAVPARNSMTSPLDEDELAAAPARPPRLIWCC